MMMTTSKKKEKEKSWTGTLNATIKTHQGFLIQPIYCYDIVAHFRTFLSAWNMKRDHRFPMWWLQRPLNPRSCGFSDYVYPEPRKSYCNRLYSNNTLFFFQTVVATFVQKGLIGTSGFAKYSCCEGLKIYSKKVLGTVMSVNNGKCYYVKTTKTKTKTAKRGNYLMSQSSDCSKMVNALALLNPTLVCCCGWDNLNAETGLVGERAGALSRRVFCILWSIDVWNSLI